MENSVINRHELPYPTYRIPLQVTVLHNGARAVAISRELVARGARVTHFVKEGSEVAYGSTPRLRIGN